MSGSALPFVKIYGTILRSTVWLEDHATVRLWLAMLVLADADGYVEGSVPGLAHQARLSLSECERSLAILAAPDPHSKSRDEDGRRIIACDGGWRLVNAEKYRNMRTSAQIKQAERTRRHRARKADGRPLHVTGVTPCNAQREIERESKKDTEGVEAPGLLESGEEEIQVENPAATGDGGAVSRPPAAPYAKIRTWCVEAWSGTGLRIPVDAKSWSDARRSHVRRAWRAHPSESWWRGFFSHVAASTFLTTKFTGFDFDWMVKPGNLTKIIEGKYHDGAQYSPEDDQLSIDGAQSGARAAAHVTPGSILRANYPAMTDEDVERYQRAQRDGDSDWLRKFHQENDG